MHTITNAEHKSILTKRARTMNVPTVRAGGSPHVTPTKVIVRAGIAGW